MIYSIKDEYNNEVRDNRLRNQLIEAFKRDMTYTYHKEVRYDIEKVHTDRTGFGEMRIRKANKRIALCIGHNAKSQGAVGSKGISEYVFNKGFLHELLPYLPPTNEYKIFERKTLGGYNAEQADLHSQISVWGECDIAMEFHFNGALDAKVNGHEILYLSQRGMKLAEKLDRKFDKHLNNNDRGIKKRDSGNGHGFLVRGNYASLIVEPFFASFQHRFTEDGELMQPLIAAYKEFFLEV